MLKRKISGRLNHFFETRERKALLISGARQVGKTYSIDAFAREHYERYIRINFIETPQAVSLVDGATGARDLLLRISALTNSDIIAGKTLIFFDEVQKCPNIVTAIKFLVEEGSCQYILSGSLLGVDLKNIRSIPVGYMEEARMYPLDLEEFCWANGVAGSVMDHLRDCCVKQVPVDTVVHEQMIRMLRLYLIVGGMPAVVQKLADTNNLRPVVEEQHAILQMYRADIAQYDPENKLYLEEILEMIPAQLNAKNKRFILKNLNEHARFSRYENSFIWLKDAGVALPVYCAEEPTVPLVLSKATNLFKLFLNDVGLLASMYMEDIQVKILNGEINMNFGAVYENFAAQEMKSHGFDLYYFNSKKQGELDFLIEKKGKVVPIEIKSGKDYKRHAALTAVMNNLRYDIPEGIVYQNENVQREGKILYLPVYMIMFQQRSQEMEDMPLKMDFGALREGKREV